MLEEDFYFKYLININKVSFTMEMCIAKPRMHSVCVVGWAGPGGGMDYYWLCPRNEKGMNDKIEEKKGPLMIVNPKPKL